MIDSTIVRAHQQTAARKRIKRRFWSGVEEA